MGSRSTKEEAVTARALRMELTAEQLRTALRTRRLSRRRLLRSAADSASGDTLLVVSARAGNAAYVAALIDAGATVADASEAHTGACIAAVAVRAGSRDVLALLLDRGAPLAKDSRGWTPLHLAASLEDRAVFDLVLKKSDAFVRNVRATDGCTALQVAVRAGHVEHAIALAQSGCSVHTCDQKGVTALHDAVERREFGLVNELVRIGACVDVTDRSGRTLLHVAAANFEPRVFELLLGAVKTASARDRAGNTVLHELVRNKCDVTTLRTLLARAPDDASSRNKAGKTPYELACDLGFQEAIEILEPETLTPRVNTKVFKIQFISDVHLEFGSNPDIKPVAPILALLGDTCLLCQSGVQSYPSVYDRFLSDVSTKFERVLVIMGNHEYYRSDVKQARSTLASICAKYPNVTLLLSQSTVIDNIRIVGCTLWTEVPDEYAFEVHRGLSDYRAITDGGELLTVSKSNVWHRKDRAFIANEIAQAKELGQKVIVLTHHGPLFDSGTGSPDTYSHVRRYALNSDQRALLGPPVIAWLYGHTHWWHDMTISSTRIMSNPHGYPHEGIDWDPSCVFQYSL